MVRIHIRRSCHHHRHHSDYLVAADVAATVIGIVLLQFAGGINMKNPLSLGIWGRGSADHVRAACVGGLYCRQESCADGCFCGLEI